MNTTAASEGAEASIPICTIRCSLSNVYLYFAEAGA